MKDEDQEQHAGHDSAPGGRQRRRTFIKATGLGVGGALLGLGGLSGCRLTRASTPGAAGSETEERSTPNPIVRENQRAGTRAWAPAHVDEDASVEGYTMQDSVAPGETLQFCVSSVPAEYTIDLYRIGWYDGDGGRKVASLTNTNGEERPVPDPQGPEDLITCTWPVTDEVSVTTDWTTGLYYALFKGGGQASACPFVVREPAPSAQMLVQLPFHTLQSYNGWGGRSFYSFKSDDDEYHDAVSYNRPYDNAYSMHLGYAIHFIRWAERHGYSMAYATNLDMMRQPEMPSAYNLAACVGHDEYPPIKQYDAYKEARDSGTNLMFIGGNLWTTKIRFRERDRTMMRSDDWPEWEEARVTGLEFGPGTSLWKLADLTVTDPSHAWFEGTGFEEGEKVVGVVGHEWDKLVPESPDSARRLFRYEKGTQPDPISNDADADAIVYTADSGARVFNCGVLGWPYRLDPDSTWGQNEWPLSRMNDFKPEVLEPDPKLQAFQRNVTDDLIAASS